MKQSIIGISSSVYPCQENEQSYYQELSTPYEYVDAIFQAGGLPIVLPQLSGSEESLASLAAAYVSQLDGLVITGGKDVDPSCYGEEPTLKLGPTSLERDRSELALLRAAQDNQIPVLGICRGLQLMNVFFGGTLYQDLSQQAETWVKHSQATDWKRATHSIKLETGSWLAAALGDSIHINSYHHQAVKEPGEGLRVTAIAPDGVIEALETEDLPVPMIGVQWHPELLCQTEPSHIALFDQFIGLVQSSTPDNKHIR